MVGTQIKKKYFSYRFSLVLFAFEGYLQVYGPGDLHSERRFNGGFLHHELGNLFWEFYDSLTTKKQR